MEYKHKTFHLSAKIWEGIPKRTPVCHQVQCMMGLKDSPARSLKEEAPQPTNRRGVGPPKELQNRKATSALQTSVFRGFLPLKNSNIHPSSNTLVYPSNS